MVWTLLITGSLYAVDLLSVIHADTLKDRVQKQDELFLSYLQHFLHFPKKGIIAKCLMIPAYVVSSWD